MPTFALLPLLLACVGKPARSGDTDSATGDDSALETGDSAGPPDGATDADADGASPPDDCDDLDASVHPGAPEACDGQDNDCDGTVDDACGTTGAVLTTDLAITLVGPCPGPWSGPSVLLTDLDGDGRADAFASLDDCPEPALVGLLGPFGPTNDLATPDLSRPYGGSLYRFDAGVDLTGDGVDDWLIVAGDPAEDTVAARLFAGPLTGAERDADAILTVAIPPTDWGAPPYAVDVTLLPGSPGHLVLSQSNDAVSDAGNSYQSFVVSAAPGSTSTEDAALATADEGSSYTRGTARWLRPGDVDGDGLDDLCRGVDGAVDVYLAPFTVDGGTLDTELHFTSDATLATPAMRNEQPLDLDGDGLPDVPVLVATEGAYTTVVHTHVGGDGAIALDTADVTLTGTESLYSLAALDRNGDGVQDLAAGAPGSDALHAYAGAVYVLDGPLSGPRDLTTADVVVQCPDVSCQLGIGLSAGDTNADGFDDLLLGGYATSDADPFAWLVYGGGS